MLPNERGWFALQICEESVPGSAAHDWRFVPADEWRFVVLRLHWLGLNLQEPVVVRPVEVSRLEQPAGEQNQRLYRLQQPEWRRTNYTYRILAASNNRTTKLRKQASPIGQASSSEYLHDTPQLIHVENR